MTWSWKEILNHLPLANNANPPGWGATEGGLSVEWWRASGVDVGGWCPEVCLPCFFLQTSNGFLDFQKRSSMVLFRQKKLTLDGRIRKYRILMDFVFLNHWWQNLMSDAWSVYIYIYYILYMQNPVWAWFSLPIGCALAKEDLPTFLGDWGALMHDPVSTPDGYLFERAAIEVGGPAVVVHLG